MKNDRAVRKYRFPHIFVFGLIAGLAILGLSAASAQAQCAAVSTANINTIKNVPVTVPVTTSDLTGLNVFAADFSFDYNPSVITYVSVTSGTVAPTAFINVNPIINNATSATLVISVFDFTAFAGAGALVNINFDVIGATTTTSPLTLSNFRYNGGSVCSTLSSGTLTVIPASTITTVTSNNNPSVYGQNVTFTAQVSSTPAPATGGTVDFIVDGIPFAGCTAVPLSMGTATCTTNALGAGNHPVSAQYSGTIDFSASSGTLGGGQNVSLAPSVVAVVCPPSAVYTGSPIEVCSYTVTGANLFLGPFPVPSGGYMNNVNVGTASATATYPGDANHSADSDTANFPITPATSTVAVVCAPSAVYTGSPIEVCSYTVTGANLFLGPFPVPSGGYMNNVNVGTASATATYPGDANHSGSTDTANFPITVAPTTTVVTCPVSEVYTGSAITPCTYTVTGANLSIGPLPVPPANYMNNVIVGTASASFAYVPDGNHSGSSDSENFQITQASSFTSVVCNPGVVYTGSPIEVCSYTVTGPGLLIGPVPVPPANYMNNLNVGTASASFTYPGDANHTGSTDSSTFQITRATANCTVTPYSVAYDGNPHTATGSCNGVGGQMNLATLNLSGTTHTDPGTYNDTWSFISASGNYFDQLNVPITNQIISGSVAGMINYAIVTKPVPGVTMSGAGSIPVSGMTDAMGNYMLINFGGGAYTVTPSKPTQGCSPVNVINGIFSDDASHVARYVVGLETFEPEQIQAAQVNGLSLPVSSFDAALIAQKVVGICGTAGNRSGQWVFVPGFRSYGSVIGNIMGENYLALMRGDVNGDWDPIGPNRPQRPERAEDIQNAIHMTVYGGRADRSTTLTVPVKIDNLRGAPVDAYQFDIVYDPSVVTPDAIAADLTGTLSANMSVVYNIVEPGLLKVAVYGAYPASGDGVYVNLRFVATGRSGSRSALHVDNFFVGNGTAVTYTYDGEIVINGQRPGQTADAE